MQETRVQFLGQEDPLEKEMATHSSTLAPVSMDRGAWQTIVPGVTRVGHDLITKPPPNQNVIIIEIKCKINAMHLNHAETIPTPTASSLDRLSSMNPVSGAKEVGDKYIIE